MTPRLLCFLALVATVALPACSGSGPQSPEDVPPDERFGHRYEERGPEGRDTVFLAPDDTAQAYFEYPAPLDTLIVRPAPFDPSQPYEGQRVAVEVLMKGAFPDGCAELSDVDQNRTAHLIKVDLTMRRPKGAVCPRALRPYRFYLELDGLYGPGNYLIELNDRNYVFEIRLPES